MKSLMIARRFSYLITIAISLVLIQGCSGGGGGGGGGTPPADPKYSIGGTVSGLNGTLVLKNKEEPNKEITGDGSYKIASELDDKTDYAVSIVSSPDTQKCTISNENGSVDGADVSNINVNCVTHQDASGIYTGTAELNTEPTKAMPTDFKGIIHSNRFYVFSSTENVLYDGVVTSITGSDLIANAKVYHDGVFKESVNVIGFVLSEDKITLTLNGAGVGSGTINLIYDDVYKVPATESRINTGMDEVNHWSGKTYTLKGEQGGGFLFDLLDMVDLVYGYEKPYLDPSCDYQDDTPGAFSLPDSTKNIYEFKEFPVLEVAGGCTYKGTGFNGFATVVNTGLGSDKGLWFVITNAEHSVFGVYDKP
ncbi:MAG: hypothetical protein OEY52_08495 [Gammaproteobacteria bacterium]|nr:hypothetical protein [Gammaproteobacteria bacterium]